MVAVRPIAPLMRIVEPGTRPFDRRSAAYRRGNRKLRDIVASEADPGLVARADFRMAGDRYPDDESLRVSHRSQSAAACSFPGPRSAEKRAARDQLRSKRRMRRSRRAGASGRVTRTNRRRRRLHPRKTCGGGGPRRFHGHWEGDHRWPGAKNTYIAHSGGAPFSRALPCRSRCPARTRKWSRSAALSQHVRKLSPLP